MTNPDQPDRVEHRMERTYEVAATPEQVWDAIATADGISAWMVPTRLDPQIGGEVSFDLGEFWSTVSSPTTHRTIDSRTKNRGRSLTTCRPLYHDLSSVTPIATEFLIESASGGSCVIRVVTSAYGSGADWENEFFAEMIAGWVAILDNLATHFNEASVAMRRTTDHPTPHPPRTGRAVQPTEHSPSCSKRCARRRNRCRLHHRRGSHRERCRCQSRNRRQSHSDPRVRVVDPRRCRPGRRVGPTPSRAPTVRRRHHSRRRPVAHPSDRSSRRHRHQSRSRGDPPPRGGHHHPDPQPAAPRSTNDR